MTASTVPIIEFATPRLRLRQWRDQDYPAFAAMNTDPEVMQLFPSEMERIGMHNTGSNFEHPRVPVGDPLSTHVLYEISRAEPGERAQRSYGAAIFEGRQCSA